MSSPATTAAWLVAPVVLGGLAHQAVRARDLWASTKRPLDDLLFGGRVVFGANKTLRGFLVVPAACGAFFWVERAAGAPVAAFPWWTGAAAGLGYVLAELPNSFLKRRAGVAPGARAERNAAVFFALDHLDSVFGCAVAFRLAGASWPVVVAGLVVAPAIHVLVNLVAHAAGLRNSAW